MTARPNKDIKIFICMRPDNLACRRFNIFLNDFIIEKPIQLN
jgi:hypothetical protein